MNSGQQDDDDYYYYYYYYIYCADLYEFRRITRELNKNKVFHYYPTVWMSNTTQKMINDFNVCLEKIHKEY